MGHQKFKHSKTRRCARFTTTQCKEVRWEEASETSNSWRPATTSLHPNWPNSKWEPIIAKAMLRCAWVSRPLVVEQVLMFLWATAVDLWIKAWAFHCNKPLTHRWISIVQCLSMEWITPSRTVWAVLDQIRWTQRTRRSNSWTPASMQARVQTPLTMSIRRICRPYLRTMPVISLLVFHQVPNFQKLALNNMVELTHDNLLTCTTMGKEITRTGPSCF